MAQQEGRLVRVPGNSYTLHGLFLREDDPLDILVGTAWIAGHLHYEASDDNWYCDAGPMSIPLYAGREARYRLELIPHGPKDEEELMLAALAALEEVYEEGYWDEEGFEDEQAW